MMILKVSNAYVTGNTPMSAVYSQTAAAVNVIEPTSQAVQNYANEGTRSKKLINNLNVLTVCTSPASGSSTSASSSSSSMSLSPRSASRCTTGTREKPSGIYSPLRQARGIVTRIDEDPQSNINVDNRLCNNKIEEQNIMNIIYSCGDSGDRSKNNENKKKSSSTDSAIFSSSNGASNDIRHIIKQTLGEKFRSRRQTIHSKVILFIIFIYFFLNKRTINF